MASQPLPLTPAEGAALQKRLYDRHLVEVPVSRMGDRMFLRVSIQAYNSMDDVERLPSYILARIDRAFDATLQELHPSTASHRPKRRKIDHNSEETHGGFIVEDVLAGCFA